MDSWKFIISCLGLQYVFIQGAEESFKPHPKVTIFSQLFRDRCLCRECRRPLGAIHDWRSRTVQGPAMGIFIEVHIVIKFPRAFCNSCNKVQPAYISWIHPKCESMTCGFAEVAGRLMEETTCAAAGRVLHTEPRSLWNLDQYRMQLMLQRMKLPADVDVSHLSADEVHFKTTWYEERVGWNAKRWEPHFATNLVSHKGSKVLFSAIGRGSKSLGDCLSILPEELLKQVEYFALDMHDPFIKTATKLCPNAKICVDRFHITQQLNTCFDTVRKAEFKKAKEREDIFTEGMLSPSRRFVLVEKEKHLTKSEIKMLDRLRTLNINIHTAMLLVEQLHVALDKRTLKDFRDSLLVWYRVVRESKLSPFRQFSKTIRKYRKLIEAYITSRLTTAASEGINNKIKTLKRMAYGYQNEGSFRNKILQRCGYLNSRYINTTDFFWFSPTPI